ncbi:hypothetical protein SK128_015539 [Halocaridina rubra]|uniref:Small EDRK-rich factor-like N-terminal domain-containing protein n=1 Tax=Halocaridina rubra TaxID=373956 RepID=A0AAN8X2Y8_HALRR
MMQRSHKLFSTIRRDSNAEFFDPTPRKSILAASYVIAGIPERRFFSPPARSGPTMARGHQKAQSQAKNIAKQAAIKSKQGHNANEQKKAAMKALTFQCPICRGMMPDPKTYKQHFENKHPKEPLPEELKEL